MPISSELFNRDATKETDTSFPVDISQPHIIEGGHQDNLEMVSNNQYELVCANK